MSEIHEGRIKFYDFYKPRLTAGPYKIEVEQSIDLNEISELDSNDPRGKTFAKAERTFHVVAPRFRLGPNEVHAVYPPANSQGSYDQTLPHIVLRERTLPWATSIDENLPEDADNPLPWVALLLFYNAETPEIKIRNVSEIRNPEGVSGPVPLPDPFDANKPDSDVDEGQARTIDIPAELFRSVAPQLTELPLLTHVRQVNTGDKELLGLKEEGWFSVVIGNRLPRPGEQNTAHLVSLEGWHNFLARNGPDQGSVRLVSLANWSFWTTASKGSFQEVMEAIDRDVLRVKFTAEQEQELGKLSQDGQTQAVEIVRNAIHNGYAALNFETRQGEPTAGWYRGPLLPVNMPHAPKDPYESAEAALIYDSRTGLFDASYAVAWQIGRLLALSDGHFTAALQAWRREGQRMVDRLLENLDLANRYGAGLFLGRDHLDDLDDINDEINKIPLDTLADSNNLPPDVAKKLTSIQEKLTNLQNGTTQATGSENSTDTDNPETPDFNKLVNQVDQYLQKLIDDVKDPTSRSQSLMKKVFTEEIQEKLLLSNEAPLASAPDAKASLTQDLPQLSEQDIERIKKEPDMLKRAELICQALLPEPDPVTIPPDSF